MYNRFIININLIQYYFENSIYWHCIAFEVTNVFTFFCRCRVIYLYVLVCYGEELSGAELYFTPFEIFAKPK